MYLTTVFSFVLFTNQKALLMLLLCTTGEKICNILCAAPAIINKAMLSVLFMSFFIRTGLTCALQIFYNWSKEEFSYVIYSENN